MMLRSLTLAVLAGCMPFSLSSYAVAEENVSTGPQEKTIVMPEELMTGLSLSELLGLRVESVSRRGEPLFTAASAVHVVTNEYINKHNVRTLPDALRQIPGVLVNQIDSNKWEVAIRGYEHRFSNKLLVLMDGRSIFTPTFSGVLWSQHDTIMEDLETVEVIRGSGGTLWGANAMNGVVNISSKDAFQTLGPLFSVGVGTQMQDISARYGMRIGNKAAMRVSGRFKNFDTTIDRDDPNEVDATDEWDSTWLGFRSDWDPNLFTRLTIDASHLSGTFSEKELNASFVPPEYTDYETYVGDMRASHLRLKYELQLDNNKEVSAQAWYNSYNQKLFAGVHDETESYDGEIQFHHKINRFVQYSAGAGFRETNSQAINKAILIIPKTHRNQFNAFAFGTINPVQDWGIDLGLKYEEHEWTGGEWMPNARSNLRINDRHAVWVSWSQATRVPANYERQSRIVETIEDNGGPVVVTTLVGNQDINIEKMESIEFGHRMRIGYESELDWTLYYNSYDQLMLGREPNTLIPGTPPFVYADVSLENAGDGWVRGGEGALTTKLSRTINWWNAYSYYESNFRNPENYQNVFVQNKHPTHKIDSRLTWSLNPKWETSFQASWIDDLLKPHRAQYTKSNWRLHWNVLYQAREDLQMNFSLQNINDDPYQQTRTTFAAFNTKVPMAAYLRVTWTP